MRAKKIYFLTALVIVIPIFFLMLHGSEPQRILWGTVLEGFPITEKQLDSFERDSGISSDIVTFYHSWSPQENILQRNALNNSLSAIKNRGALPCMTWEPMIVGSEGIEKNISSQDVTNGFYDEYIQSVALAIKEYNDVVIIRFAHEMNIPRYQWGVIRDTQTQYYPALYKEMFQYVVDIFKSLNVENAIWAFCPNAESVPDPSKDAMYYWNTIGNYYPGNDYIDIIGLDGYNWGNHFTDEKDGWESHWRSFKSIFFESYNIIRMLAPEKPCIIFETGSPRGDGEHARIEWLVEALEVAWQWDVLGICWFQVNKELDWRLHPDEVNTIPMEDHDETSNSLLYGKRKKLLVKKLF